MGYMRHHAIIVTSWNGEAINVAYGKAHEIFTNGNFSSYIVSPINGYLSFVIGPDGSKEGWEDSKIGDAQRKEFIEWLKGQRYSDGSSLLDWVYLQYGDDNKETVILDHSDLKE